MTITLLEMQTECEIHHSGETEALLPNAAKLKFHMHILFFILEEDALLLLLAGISFRSSPPHLLIWIYCLE